MRILILGCNGMAGHMIGLYLKERGYNVEGFARKKSKFFNTIVGDVKNTELLLRIIEGEKYNIMINCVGILNQDAENNHEKAVYLNSYFPHFLEKTTENLDTQIIHISTDCVFSGRKGKYTEKDFPDGEKFYDRSKALGELINNKDVTLRMSIIGPDINKEGIGLINWFMQQKDCVNGYKNVIWTGQTTLQLAKTIEKIIIDRPHGLYNMVPENSISKYDLLLLFNRYLKHNQIKIEPEENIKIDKSLKRTNYEKFNYIIPEYEQQLKDLEKWMNEHKELYPHYHL